MWVGLGSRIFRPLYLVNRGDTNYHIKAKVAKEAVKIEVHFSFSNLMAPDESDGYQELCTSMKVKYGIELGPQQHLWLASYPETGGHERGVYSSTTATVCTLLPYPRRLQAPLRHRLARLVADVVARDH